MSWYKASSTLKSPRATNTTAKAIQRQQKENRSSEEFPANRETTAFRRPGSGTNLACPSTLWVLQACKVSWFQRYSCFGFCSLNQQLSRSCTRAVPIKVHLLVSIPSQNRVKSQMSEKPASTIFCLPTVLTPGKWGKSTCWLLFQEIMQRALQLTYKEKNIFQEVHASCSPVTLTRPHGLP